MLLSDYSSDFRDSKLLEEAGGLLEQLEVSLVVGCRVATSNMLKLCSIVVILGVVENIFHSLNYTYYLWEIGVRYFTFLHFSSLTFLYRSRLLKLVSWNHFWVTGHLDVFFLYQGARVWSLNFLVFLIVQPETECSWFLGVENGTTHQYCGTQPIAIVLIASSRMFRTPNERINDNGSRNFNR